LLVDTGSEKYLLLRQTLALNDVGDSTCGRSIFHPRVDNTSG
jgi:hypothetical protein